MTTLKRRGRRSVLVAIATGACLVLAVVAPAAQGAFFEGASGSLVGPTGEAMRQAGSHPDLDLTFNFGVKQPEPGVEIPGLVQGVPAGHLRDVEVALPPGFVGNPTVAPTCKFSELNVPAQESECPTAAQIGFVRVFEYPQFEQIPTIFTKPIYNMAHGDDVPALFAFKFLNAVSVITPRVRPDDYGLTSASLAISPSIPIYRVEVELWGVPGDVSHDPERIGEATPAEPFRSPGARFSGTPRAFLSLPTHCSGRPESIGLTVDSWENPSDKLLDVLSSDSAGVPLQFEGCESVPFAPSVSTRATSGMANSPVGINVDINIPQSDSPGGLASADVRKTVVKLPEGFAISTSAAKGLSGCAQSQVAIGSSDPPTCPDSSKIGSVKIKTPLLSEELDGNVFLAKQADNPFNSLLALYLVVQGPGFYLKLPGKVEADPNTGQLTTTFDNTPQLPFEELQLSLDSGPRAPLRAPGACGTYNTQVEMTSWSSSSPVKLSTPMTIGEGCGAAGFSPALHAGTANPVAGAWSPFTLQVTRIDGEQNLSRIEATLPEGLLAKLAGVPLCPDAQATTGACPPASQVGTTTVGVGAGPNPLYVPEAGKEPTAVYLAGPYKGAPYSLVVKVPAQAGPFDLGTVTVRNGLYVDPYTTQVTAKSDPLPQILEGIPLSYRDVRVEINRPEFIVNPTNCEPMKVTSTLTSIAGATASPSTPFEAANCEALDFAPKLALSLSGGTARAKNPALKAVLTAPAGQANIGKVQVVLPKSVFIDNRHISNPCTRVQFDAGAGNGTQCPAKSILGKATAYSPLLEAPLTGNVYFRSNGGERKLPDLVASLNGEIHVNLVGFIDSVHKKGSETSRTRNTFASVPDAPVSRFVLELSGGKKGLLQNSTNLCRSTNKASVKMDGQNGKVNDFETVVKPSCGKAKSSKPAKKK